MIIAASACTWCSFNAVTQKTDFDWNESTATDCLKINKKNSGARRQCDAIVVRRMRLVARARAHVLYMVSFSTLLRVAVCWRQFLCGFTTEFESRNEFNKLAAKRATVACCCRWKRNARSRSWRASAMRCRAIATNDRKRNYETEMKETKTKIIWNAQQNG